MNERYDGLLMVLLGIVIVLLIGYRVNRWLMSPQPDLLRESRSMTAFRITQSLGCLNRKDMRLSGVK